MTLGPAIGWAQPAEVAGTLPEDYFPALRPLLQSAVGQSPTLLEKRIEVLVNEARTYAVNAQRLPRFGVSFDYAQNQVATTESTTTRTRDHGLFYRVELSQAIFHWNALKNESARAALGVAIAEKSYQEAARQLLQVIRQSYLLLVAKKSLLVQARERQRLREENLKLARNKFALGTVAEAEVTRLLIDVEEQGLEVQRSEVEFVNGRRALARLAGVADVPEADVPSDVPEFAFAAPLAASLLADLLRDGAKSAFEVQVHELQRRDADLKFRIAAVRLYPKFGLSAGHYVDNTTNATQFSVDQRAVERQAVALRADWSIFDGFATKGAKREALAEKRLAERRMATASERVLEEAQKTERAIGLEAQAVKLTDRRRALANAYLPVVAEEVKRGRLAQAAADEAQANIHASTAASAFARARLLTEWSALVSLAGADPFLKTLPAGHAREKR